ncbi:MAG: FAD-dependent monooxygenase, partial [Rhodospirillaceae bacterium]
MVQAAAAQSAQTSENTIADVLIVGGGLVGGTLACALARHGVPVAVIDTEDPDVLLSQEYDGRCSAVAIACVRLLKAIGLWELMEANTQPILDIRVADGHSPMFLHYHQDDAGGPMGYMAENRAMRKAIVSLLPTLPAAKLYAPARLASLERGPDGVTATLDDGREIRARLAVAADGRGSRLRRDAGIGIRSLGYDQTAIVLTVETERPHEGCAHELFRPSGPFAILPMPGNTASLVWTESTRDAPRILGLPEDLFQL